MSRKTLDAIPPKMAEDAAVNKEPLPLNIQNTNRLPMDNRTIAIVARDPETPGEEDRRTIKPLCAAG